MMLFMKNDRFHRYYSKETNVHRDCCLVHKWIANRPYISFHFAIHVRASVSLGNCEWLSDSFWLLVESRVAKSQRILCPHASQKRKESIHSGP
jgi:hypothetical protein